jgi:hypothetical protein
VIFGIKFVKEFNLEFNRPIFGSYSSDEKMYLQTYYFHEDGMHYYQALQLAQSGDSRGIILSNDVFKWRYPTLILFWSILTGEGSDIIYIFLGGAAFSLVAIYTLLYELTRDKNLALISSGLTLLYIGSIFVYPTSILFHEWWAWMSLAVGYALLVKNANHLSYPFFIFGMSIRELSLIAVVGSMAASIFVRKQRLYFISLVIIGIGIQFMHSRLVQIQFPLEDASQYTNSVLERLQWPSRSSFLPMISFGTQWFPFKELKIQLILIVSAIFGLILNREKIISSSYAFFIAGILALIIIFPFIVTSEDTAYWGIMFMPFFIPLSTLVLTSIKPRVSKIFPGRNFS